MSVMHRLLRKPFFGRFESKWIWPVNSPHEDWQRVTFKNKRGANLAGLWGVGEGEIKGSLVLAHPMGKAAKGFWLRYEHAQFFRKCGFNVLTFDANGFGESEAISFDYPDDILSAGICAQAKFPNLPIGLVGASFGAGWGICAMAREGSPFAFAILESAFPTLPDFWRHYPVAHFALKASQWVWPSLERNLRPEHDSKNVKNTPNVLLIYSDADKFTPPDHGKRLLSALKHSSHAQMHVVSGAEHTFAFRDSKERYVDLVVPFLDSNTQSAMARS